VSVKTKLLLTAVDKTKRAFQSAEKNVSGLTKSVNSAQRAFSALVAGAVVKNIAEAGLAMDRFRRAFRVGTGSVEAANREMQFVIDTSLKLGTNLEASAAAYSKLTAASQGTALQGKETQKIFEAVSKASVVLGLTADQANNALVAFEQIISKGKVSAEELRRQLSNVLPGSFSIAARSIGKTTAELDAMLKAGELTAEDLLPKLARELIRTFDPAVEDAANSAQASFARFQTSVFLLKSEIAEGGLLPALATLADHIRVLIPGGDMGFGMIASDIEREIKVLEKQAQIIRGIIKQLQGTSVEDNAGRSLFGVVIKGTEDFQAELDGLIVKIDKLNQKQQDVMTNAPTLDAINITGALGEIGKIRAEYDKFLDGLDSNAKRSFDTLIKRFETAEQKADKMRRTLVRFKDEMDPAEFKRISDAIKRTLTDGIDEIDIDFDKMRRDWKEQLKDMRQNGENEFDAIAAAAEQAARNIQDAFADFLFDPFDKGIKGMLKSFLDAIRRMLANQAATQLFGFLKRTIPFPKPGGGVPVPRADGGPVSAGNSFLVGERGPELFIPRKSGMIIPNNKMGGNTVVVNQSYTINGADPERSAELLAPVFQQNKLDTIAMIQDMRARRQF